MRYSCLQAVIFAAEFWLQISSHPSNQAQQSSLPTQTETGPGPTWTDYFYWLLLLCYYVSNLVLILHIKVVIPHYHFSCSKGVYHSASLLTFFASAKLIYIPETYFPIPSSAACSRAPLTECSVKSCEVFFLKIIIQNVFLICLSFLLLLFFGWRGCSVLFFC